MNLIQRQGLPGQLAYPNRSTLYILLVGRVEVSRLKDLLGREQNVACFDLAAVEERIEFCDKFFAFPFSAQPTLKVVPANLRRDLVRRMDDGDLFPFGCGFAIETSGVFTDGDTRRRLRPQGGFVWSIK